MNFPPISEHVRALFQIPPDASEDDIFECVFACLVDGLGCEMISPRQLAEDERTFLGGWYAPDGTRYEGRGGSGREAALAGAVEFIRRAPEAAQLRTCVEESSAFAA